MKRLVLAVCAGLLFGTVALAQSERERGYDRERDADRDSHRESDRRGHRHGHTTQGVTKVGEPNPYEPKVGAPNPYATQGGTTNPYATQGGEPARIGTGAQRR
jgi:Ni/Co efflux regulator RcnB